MAIWYQYGSYNLARWCWNHPLSTFSKIKWVWRTRQFNELRPCGVIFTADPLERFSDCSPGQLCRSFGINKEHTIWLNGAKPPLSTFWWTITFNELRLNVVIFIDQLVEQLTHDPTFEGSDPAATGTGRIQRDNSYVSCLIWLSQGRRLSLVYGGIAQPSLDIPDLLRKFVRDTHTSLFYLQEYKKLMYLPLSVIFTLV